MSNKQLIQKLLDASSQINNASRKVSANYMLVNSKVANYFRPINFRRQSKIKKILILINKKRRD